MISDDEYKSLESWTKEFIDKQCIVRNTKMPGKVPGTMYSWMFYLRNGLFNHSFLTAISQMFLYKIQKEVGHFDFQLAGLETASTPMLATFPLMGRFFKVDINAFSVRKEQKQYGLQNWIEGVPNNKPVMLIDDLCNSSNSLRRCYDIVTATDVNEKPLEVINYAFVIVNKVNKEIHDEERQITDMNLPSNIKIIYLFDLDDFNLFKPSH